MHHCSEEDLILHHYGEHADPRGIGEHLRACANCREAFATLQRVLAVADALPVPERSEAYGREVWHRVRPHLPERREGLLSRIVPQWQTPRWAMAGGLAALLVAAFVAGRYSLPGSAPAGTPTTSSTAIATAADPAQSQQVRERVLIVAVGDHLDRSQMVLAELVNATPDGARTARSQVDISGEQVWAEELLASNRLYRQTAAQTGQTTVESVLDELEPILLEIAHSPSSITAAQLAELKERIEAQGLLFKIRVVESNMRERQRTATPASGPVS